MSAIVSSNSFRAKLFEINWLFLALIYLIGSIGVAMIFAATDGAWDRGAQQHLIRLIAAGGLLFVVAMINIKVWYHLAYPIFLLALLLLLGVDLVGTEVNGSQRWLRFAGRSIQPSEIMKLAIVLALARFYHDLPNWRISHITGLAGALVMIALPTQFILRQPDLGTTLLLVGTALVMVFLAGINWRVIFSASIFAGIALPLFYRFGLAPYQRARINTFINPENDPTGAGYHIAQSKIALGSGGVSGKGYMQGTQRQLEYVPENTTDFIFTVIGEEFGLIGGLVTMALYAFLIGLCIWLALQCKNTFSKLLVLGITTTFSFYVFINLAMVMGLAPVVGVPLPLISYGGTVILAVMFGFGLIMSAHIHRQTELPRGAN